MCLSLTCGFRGGAGGVKAEDDPNLLILNGTEGKGTAYRKKRGGAKNRCFAREGNISGKIGGEKKGGGGKREGEKNGSSDS